jgi:hypothetical protein
LIKTESKQTIPALRHRREKNNHIKLYGSGKDERYQTGSCVTSTKDARVKKRSVYTLYTPTHNTVHKALVQMQC